jgi:hypothetical protein
MLGSISLGTKFIFRTEEILGAQHANRRRHSFDDEVLTVVLSFRPHYVNNVVVVA